MEEIERFKEKILKEYPRMTVEDKFRFDCHSSISCFNQCCRDINIFLTPYDVLNMRKALNITSGEFLEKYTILPIDKNQQYPVVILTMQDDEEKKCHFVRDEGCIIYANRPWACRMYVVGLASPKEDSPEKEFYFLMQDEECKGLNEQREWTLREWFNDQGINNYNKIGESFKEIILHDWFKEGNPLSPKQIEMFYMVCYDMDKFREFIFETSFLNRFLIDEELIERLKTDDEALLQFGFKWLKYCLFKEPTMESKNQSPAEKTT